MRGEPETVGELGRRMSVVEHELDELRELVDGQESWSHRKRLHALEDDHRAAELVREALKELRKARAARRGSLREWGSLAVALAALLTAIVVQLHGG